MSLFSSTNQLDLDSGKVSTLLFRYAAPSIISMTAASLYNIVDSIFIGRGVGPYAISGMALTLPVTNLSVAFGTLIGIGGSSLISVKLGQRDYKTASNSFGNSFVLNIILGSIVGILGLIFLSPLLTFFGASDQTMPYAKEYMQILLLGNVITHTYFGLNDHLRASGYPQKAMFATFTAVGLNCILDPLFIFVFHWGLRGAAIATLLAQIAAFTYVLIHYTKPTSHIHFQRGIYKIQPALAKSMVSVGLAPFLLNVCNCLIVIVLNKQFFKYGGDLAIGAYGITNRTIFFFVMLIMGLTQGMTPLVGFNYGAKKYGRVISIVRLTTICASVVTITSFIVCQFFTKSVVGLFTTHSELTDLSIQGLRISTTVFFVVAIPMISSHFFQAIRKPGKAIFLSLTRQVIFLLPMLFILPNFFGIRGVWMSLPVSDSISVIVAFILLTRELNHFRKLEAAQQNTINTTL